MINSVCIFGDSVARGVVFDAVKNKYSLLRESFANIVEKQQHITISNFAEVRLHHIHGRRDYKAS